MNSWGLGLLHGIFWELSFSPGIFGGFPICPNSIASVISITWNLEYPPRLTQWGPQYCMSILNRRESCNYWYLSQQDTLYIVGWLHMKNNSCIIFFPTLPYSQLFLVKHGKWQAFYNCIRKNQYITCVVCTEP